MGAETCALEGHTVSFHFSLPDEIEVLTTKCLGERGANAPPSEVYACESEMQMTPLTQNNGQKYLIMSKVPRTTLLTCTYMDAYLPNACLTWPNR